MKDLQISLTGKITDTNFDEWKGALIKQIESSVRDLATDDDFALAEKDVKALKAGENALKNAKQSALDQAAEIQKLFEAIDEVSDKARQARLSLERQIKQRKAEIRDDIVVAGMKSIEDYLSEQSGVFASVNKEQFMTRAQLTEFTKGKRSYKSMQKAIDDAVADVKTRIDGKATSIDNNEKTLNTIGSEHASLFQDKSTLLAMDSDQLSATIRDRIAFYEEEQARQQKEQAVETIDQGSTESPAEENTTAQPPPEEPTPSGIAAARFTISIEVFADEADATEFLDELEGRFGHREMVGEISLNRG